ncbi:hypothetical protein HAX54_032761 [Datura stramonium]|uniref:Uncharacterized protein n=1 Tax=Datura stramonium TaxID=4076 RepID=A0ABS8VC89_DATST|nr:hypothetical protein [Datura stramonium]
MENKSVGAFVDRGNWGIYDRGTMAVGGSSEYLINSWKCMFVIIKKGEIIVLVVLMIEKLFKGPYPFYDSPDGTWLVGVSKKSTYSCKVIFSAVVDEVIAEL